MKTIQERIAEWTAKRATTLAALQELVNKSVDSGETLDAEQKQKHKDLKAELVEIDEHITLLKESEALMVKTAPSVGVEDGGNQPGGGTAVQLRPGARISVEGEKLEKGIAFARYVKCVAAAQGSRSEALEIAKSVYPNMKPLHTILKSAVAAGTTTDATWAGGLIEYNLFAGDFIDYLRPLTIIGQFGANGIPALFPVPFNIEVPRQTSGGTGYWVGQGAPAPLTKFDFDRANLAFTKVANIAVLTSEIIRFSNPGAEGLVRNALGQALIAKLDADFVDPSVAAVANVSPASLTNGVTPVSASGVNAAAIRADIASIMNKFITANLSLKTGVWIMSPVTAMRLSLMTNGLGQPEFPDISMMGGKLQGLPVITSNYVPNSVSGGSMVVLMDASEVYLADDGTVVIDASREASLQMDNAPTNNASTGTGSTMVSMFQTDSVAIKAQRFINWQKRRSAGVQYVDAAHWGE
jgi:HK97 family phage major capsid protein